jgi:proline iminopeptidase
MSRQVSKTFSDYKDGYVAVSGYELYYKTFGSDGSETLLCVHGGPGLTHDYILSMADLAKDGFKVVFYDQLGCGKSDVPKNLNMFTIERAVEDLEGFRREMNLGKVHLFGSSYGGLIAIAYALKYQKNLKSLISAGGLASVPHAIMCMEELKAQLPPDVRDVMKKYEDAGDYGNPEYVKAVDVFYKSYFCRLPEWPKEVMYSLEHVSLPVYGTMNGPNEFTVVGNIRHWDVSPQLGGIRVPTLVTTGKYDEVSPKEARNIHNGIRGSRLVIFQKSAHLTMWEEREKYMNVMQAYLNSVTKKVQRKH